MYFKDEVIDEINNVFANFEIIFRDLEKCHKTRGLFPTISLPSILHEMDENIEIDSDHEKTIYYKNGKVHREDGPAIQYHKNGQMPDGTLDEYWLEGKHVTKKDIVDLLAKQEEEREYVIYIGEREYKIKGKKKLQEIEKLLK
jgi:hypothetical protein